ncbi:ECF-type sigma factor [Verrucomicrobia bacterium]|nr:ECF-type sigma factor [Verrucomicrobiota bacterium]MDA7627793.1 ECF-type sigma factor [Verrucomicrobiota bacterium]
MEIQRRRPGFIAWPCIRRCAGQGKNDAIKKNHESIEEQDYVLRQNAENQNAQLDGLYEQVAKLNEVERSLKLMMIDGYSYREISNVLGISESHVGVRLNRIKRRLTEQSRLVKVNGI